MTRQKTTCSGCGRSGMVELQMKTKGGHELTMLSCSRCERRSWLSDGQPVSRDEALRLTSGDPDFVHQPAQRKVRVRGG